MWIASWNVNSILARLPRLLVWLQAERPDVVCLQETKTRDEAFPHQALAQVGYRALIRGEKSYNGVAVLTRTDGPAAQLITATLPKLTRDGAPIDESRFLLADVGGVLIGSVYVPNGRELDTPHATYKALFLQRLAQVAEQAIDKERKLLLAGDFNVAPRPDDVSNPDHWAKGVLFHPSMRRALQVLFDAGLTDVLPTHHPEAGQFSWWDYRHLAFAKNNGLRIDLLMASPALARMSRDAGVHRDMRKGERPSDHVPVWAKFAL